MSNKTLEGMARVYETRILAKKPWSPTEPMRAALLWLAANVSDEMVEAFIKKWEAEGGTIGPAISAALRAAAGSALEASPPNA